MASAAVTTGRRSGATRTTEIWTTVVDGQTYICGTPNASKAGVEHFANALSLEMKPHGVSVGSAHMSWIETPMVTEARADLPSFGEMIDKLPPPLNKTTDVQTCATAFVEAFEKRKRRVYVPGWVGVLGRLRMLLTTAAGERLAGSDAGEAMKGMDEQVRRLGRSMSERYAR